MDIFSCNFHVYKGKNVYIEDSEQRTSFQITRLQQQTKSIAGI